MKAFQLDRYTALAALLLGGGCVLSAQGELPDVQVTEHDVAIPAVPARAGATDVPVTVSFVQKPARAGIKGSAFSDVRVLGVALEATSGVPDLSFVTALSLHATSPETEARGLPPVLIADYHSGVSGAAGAVLVMENHIPPDVTELWRGSEVVFTLQATGRMPDVAWTADVGLRFEATISY